MQIHLKIAFPSRMIPIPINYLLPSVKISCQERAYYPIFVFVFY
jgi:hypothetical protein